LIQDIQEYYEKYPNIYIFSYENPRNTSLQVVRKEWQDSKFFFGKNKIMRLGLEAAEIDEKFVNDVEGQRGLLFTTHDEDVVTDWFKDFFTEEFARGGFKATEKVVLPEGPLSDFSHAIEPHLRKLGMPTKLDKGIVSLVCDFTVCEKGQILTPEQAKILKLIHKPMAKFHVTIESSFSKEVGYKRISKEIDVLSKKKNSRKSITKAKDRVKDKKSKAGSKKKGAEKMEDSDGEENEEEMSDEDMSDEEMNSD
jgi:mRNA turnover protein 4